MKLIKIFALIICIAILWGCLHKRDPISTPSSQTNTVIFNKPRDVAYFPDYIDALKVYAKEQGIDDKTIDIAFEGIHYVEHVIKADKGQPEKKITLNEYLSRIVSPARVALAKQKYLEFYPQLTQATTLTHIPQTYILALWGVESTYGKYQGKEDIISALSTLAFEGRRESFFAKELISALTILQNGHIQKSEFRGSWAGAMGQNQFMPSSYLAYGLDGDNDGVIDIWNNMADVFASTGNYLSTVGWNSQERWGNKIKIPQNFDITQLGLESDKSKLVVDWLDMGVKFIGNEPAPSNTTQAWIVVPEVGTDEGYLVYNNFRTLMHWNRSYHFAISVGMLVDSLSTETLNTGISK